MKDKKKYEKFLEAVNSTGVEVGFIVVEDEKQYLRGGFILPGDKIPDEIKKEFDENKFFGYKNLTRQYRRKVERHRVDDPHMNPPTQTDNRKMRRLMNRII